MERKPDTGSSFQSSYSMAPGLQREPTDTYLNPVPTPNIRETSFVSSFGNMPDQTSLDQGTPPDTSSNQNGVATTGLAKPPMPAAGRGNALMSRLYNTPASSKVVQIYKNISNKGIAVPNGDSSQPLVPHPPSSKVQGAGPFRTTFYKKDQERRKIQMKNRQEQKSNDGTPKLDVSTMLRRRPSKEVLPPIQVEQPEDAMSDATSEINLEEEVESVKDEKEMQEKKTVTFIKVEGETAEPHVAEEKPDVETATVATTSAKSRRTADLRTPDLSEKGASKQNREIVLTYLKKNKYDDTEPEEANVEEWLMKLRRELGWKTELPRHGPGCRKAMDKLMENPDQKHEDSLFRKEDPGSFVYCLPKNRNKSRARYNPYHLDIVSVNAARASPVFWTVSASSVSMCIQTLNGEETFVTPVMLWLWEKRLFDMIYDLPVLNNFRIWKAYTLWKNNVRNHKTTNSLEILTKQLFCANEVLQGCVLHVQSLCEAASGSLTGFGSGEAAICLVKVNKAVTLTLKEFVATQRLQGELALKQLFALRKKVIDVVWKSCATVAEMEGVTHGIRPEKDKKVKVKKEQEQQKEVKYKIKTKYGEIPVYDKKQPVISKDRPSYAQIAEWRKILARLSEFLKSVDYLLLELLRRLVKTAVKELLNFLIASFNVGVEEEDDEEDDDEDEDNSSTEGSPLPPRKTGGGFRRGFNLRQDTPDSQRTGTPASMKHKGKERQGIMETTYDIPKFDFDKQPEETKTLNADDVMEEIKKNQEVDEEVPDPVISVQLVLNVPDNLPKSQPKSREGKRSGRDNRPFTSETGKKIVTFPDEPDFSGSESGYSDEEEEEAEEDSEFNRFKFAYPLDEEDGLGAGAEAALVDNQTKEVPKNRAHCTLSPNEYEIKRAMRGIITGFEYTVAQVGSMLREPRLAVFYSPPKHDLKLNYDEEREEEDREKQKPWPDTAFIFGEDPEYMGLIDELMNYVTQAAEQVADFSENYDKYCLMVEQARRMDVEGSMAKKQWSTDEFQHVLSIHTDQVREMKNMVLSKRLGMILLMAEKFSEACMPYPTNVLNIIHKKLPVVANKRNEDLINIIKGALKKLDHFPSSVEEFVEHLSFLGRMSSELPVLDKEFAIVTKMFSIAKDFDVAIPAEEFALYQTLAPSFQHLKSTVLFCEAKKEENIRKFSTDLDSLVNDIRFTIMEIKNKVRDPALLHADTIPLAALENIKYLQDQVQTLASKARSYGSYQDRFGSSLSQSKKFSEEYLLMDRRDDAAKAQAVQHELSEIERDLTLRRLLWESSEELTRLMEEWTSTPFDKLNVESLQKHTNRFTQTVFMLEKGLPHNEVLPKLKERVLDFKQGMPVITSLRNPALRARHWSVIEGLIGKTIMKEKNFTLGNLLDMNIFKHKDKIQDISTTASNEHTLEIMLNKVIDLWQHTDLRLVAHQGRDTWIIAGADDLLAQLEESQVTIGTIRGSRYVTPIKSQVEEWERKLTVFARTLDEWMTCQRNWLYLEQIFSTPDIQRQLPNEAKLFSQVDKTWKDIMRRTEDRPNALKAATATGTLEALQSANANLEKIHKCLEDYLETKRLVFPRFYFLSNDDLLDILAQSRNPDAVQPHLGKCFGNIKALEIKTLPRQPPTVKCMISAEGEIVQMPKNVRARGPVETWLGGVEMGMFDTVKKHLKMGLSDWVGIKLQDWVLKHPGQVVLTVAQIMFNKDVLNCFATYEPRKAMMSIQDNLVETLNVLAGLVSTNLASHKRLSIEALLIITVHNRDIVADMIDNKVTKKDDFEWMKQLRYQWDEQTNNCHVLQSNASFIYGYEYLGCSPRLVITPLTDRCYLTLTGALHLHLGGSPAGPAGTGKTETVKDLAKAMGKQCVVFNCSEGLDFKMLGKFFSGSSQSGSWSCFDEFNRIDVEVLSVVAQQLLTIKAAKDTGAPKFVFEGRDIKLNMTCGIFITMNPSYAGRVELPDNLKYLFRSVAMMVPDYTQIAEIMLFSEGFTAAKSLSGKIVNLYQLASKQLSQQDHYDFGMRAIKSVLVMSGQRKRQAQLSSDGRVKSMTEKEESYILIHSLRDANLPKFLAEDVPLFESILADLFPGIIPPEQDQGILEKAISMSIRDQGLQHWFSQIEKVKQLYSQILVRHGVMLVGPTGGGKSTARSILHRALVLLPSISTDVAAEDGLMDSPLRKPGMFVHNRSKKGRVEIFTINPKCVKLGELYGETDPNTFEWTDGLIAHAVRRFAREVASTPTEDRPSTAATALTSATGLTGATDVTASTNPSSPGPISEVGETDDQTVAGDAADHPPDHETMHEGEMIPVDWKWLVLDGPVDTIWVENLNTVLDDSKILCLANGERISLGFGMRLMFEVDNLSQASPATISRCAMVYMDPVDLGWKPYVKTWLQRLPKEIPESGKHHLQALFDHTVEKGLEFMLQHQKFQSVPVPSMSMVNCLCSILMSFFDFMSKNGGFGDPDKEVGRPSSADSHTSSQSRSSSRTDVSGTKKMKKRSRRQAKIKEELQKIEDRASAKKDQPHKDQKQYYMQKNPGKFTIFLGKLFAFAFTWAFGGSLQRFDEMDDDIAVTKKEGDKDKPDINICYEFDGFVRDLLEVEPPLGVRLPSGHKTMFSYFLDMESGNFVPWDVLVPKTNSLIEKGAVITIGDTMGLSTGHAKPGEGRLENEIVTTVDTVRYSFLTGLLLLNGHPVLLTGESGVGKSAIIKHMLKEMSKDNGTTTKNGTILGNVLNFSDKNQSLLENISSLTKFAMEEDIDTEKNLDLLMGTNKPKQNTGISTSLLQFSAQTTSARTQLSIIHRLIKKGKDTLGGPKGKKVLVFVDDFNMPAPEEYGAQPPLELLRQFLDLGGFFDTRRMLWKDIMDVTLVGACGPVGGGRNPVSPRLLKHFCMLAVPQPSTRSLQHIYQVQLGRYFQDGDFMPEVKESLFSLVSASIAMYYKMCMNMLPTPAKSHYTFNIRDLTDVITGLLQAHQQVIVNKENCAQLFSHEATRVFHDRLVDSADRAAFFSFLSETLHDYFKVQWEAESLMHTPVLFGDFSHMDDATTGKIYRPITDTVKLCRTLEEHFMTQQNIGNVQASQIVFFKEAVEHITRAARVFRQPGGHMLLVGIDGTGKSTTVQLSAHIAGCELFKLTLTRGYNMQDFRDDLKAVYKLAGVQGHNTVFLLTDSDIVKESFLEDINCILNSGEVPDLFDNEELDGIVMELKAAATEADVPDTRAAVYQFFIQRVRRNLHIVLTMSPAGNKFRHRCRMNPSLINCCTIDWYDEWNEEAMLSVASVYFSNSDFVAESGQTINYEQNEQLEDLKLRVAQVCVNIHNSVSAATLRFWEEMRRKYYTTPSSYMELIRVYSMMLRGNKKEFMDNRDRLLVGLSKLSEANSLVGTMQEELVTLGPKIEEKAKDTELLLQQLEKDQEAVDQVREIVEQEESVMKKETQIVQDYADECQQDLNSVIPALQTAIGSLDSLDKSDVAEIRVYTNPPELVMTVMASVCVLLQQKPDWATAKQVLGDAGFLKRLVQFDKNNLPDKVYNKLKKYTKHADFTPDKVGTVSVACKSMCEWVLALERYNEVYKMVKPKQRRVEEAKEALHLAQKNLAQKQSSLSKIQDHLKLLQQQYQDSVNQRESLKERKKTTALRIQRASVLISALADEKVRWAESVKVLDFKLQGLVGDTLVSAAAVAYLGAFTAKYRRELILKWEERCRVAEIPISEEYELVKIIADANQVLQWQNEGLPTDTLSTENAIFVKKGRKWPLLIDPQGQASKWIAEMEGTKLKIVQASDPNYMRTMERAIRVGEPVLLQEVTETLDPSLKPILLQETFTRGGQQLIKLGDTEIEYNENFRLYMTTSMGNPHYLPAVCIQVTIINFTVTFDGLQEQLLSMVVKQERPQLESQRSELLSSIAHDLQLLRDLEDKSLSLLQKSQGHILDDQDLVDTLKKSKVTSGEISQRVQQSEETEKSLNKARLKYLPVATRGAVLYFALSDLASVDVMYQFSLPWFQNMFITCISTPEDRPSSADRASSHLRGTLRPSSRGSPDLAPQKTEKDPPLRPSAHDLNKHMKQMIDRLTYSVYRAVSVGLFSNHQLMFSFMLNTSVMRSNAKYGDIVSQIGVIEDTEWMVFLQGSVLASMMDEDTLQAHDGLSAMQRLESQSQGVVFQRPRWVTPSMWRECQYMEATMPVFDHLLRSVMSNRVQWELFARTEDPYHIMEAAFDPAVIAQGEENINHMYKEIFHWENLSRFQRLILIKTLRPETLVASVRMFVNDQMGSKFLSTGAFDLREVFEESSAKTPLIFILSPGSDPGGQLLRFAKELRGSTLHLDMISLGRGQGPKAEELISKAQILKGRWVFLQNCHLAASWMPKLQEIVDNFNKPKADVDPQFRLWLSSKPDPSFPISILQTGFKMTVESPQGLKANLARSFGTGGTGAVSEKLYDDVDKEASWRNLLFGLCFFNAVIHERKKYGALGWNIPYEFNDSDLEVSILQLDLLLGMEGEGLPWAALRYLTGEVTYGGRVTDDWDRRCLHSLLRRFYCAEALEPGYTYSPDEVYHPLPPSFTFSEVKQYIDGLPPVDSPEVFGMNQNAEKAYLESQAKELVDTIISLQPRLSGGMIGSNKSSDELVLEMAADIMRSLPETMEDVEEEEEEKQTSTSKRDMFHCLSDVFKVAAVPGEKRARSHAPTPVADGPSHPELEALQPIFQSALVTVLRQEIDRFNNLLEIIHKSLRELCRAVKGEIVMSEPLEEAYNAMLTQKVPAQWKQAAYESCKPLGSWVKDLIQRVDFFASWSDLVVEAANRVVRPPPPPQPMSRGQTQVDAHDLIKTEARETPRSFWLPGFFFPQGFLTGVFQNHARKQGVSVDSLMFQFEVINTNPHDNEESLNDVKQKIPVRDWGFKGPPPPKEGVLVFGLYLDGARWDPSNHSVMDSLPGQRFCRLPEIHFLPAQISTTVPVQQTDSPVDNAFKTKEEDPEKKSYECPLYRTSARAGTLSSTGHSTNFVTTVHLPTDHSPEFWVTRGVALLCQLDD